VRHPARDERSQALELRDVAPHRLQSVLLTTYERAPQDFETPLGMSGVGVSGRRLGRFAKSTEPKVAGDTLNHDGHEDREGHENLKVFVTFVFLRDPRG